MRGHVHTTVCRWLYLEEHVLLAGGQVHLVLVVIHADVDNVRQQLLIAWDHFQLLMETLNSSAPRWSDPFLLLHPSHPHGVDGPPSHTHTSGPLSGGQPASSQCPHIGWSELLHISPGRELTPLRASPCYSLTVLMIRKYIIG